MRNLFDLTDAFENPVPIFNVTTESVIIKHRHRVGPGGDRQGGQQTSQGFNHQRRVRLNDMRCRQRHRIFAEAGALLVRHR